MHPSAKKRPWVHTDSLVAVILCTQILANTIDSRVIGQHCSKKTAHQTIHVTCMCRANESGIPTKFRVNRFVTVMEYRSLQEKNPTGQVGFLLGGTWRTRTAVLGFADRYLAARSRYLVNCGCKGSLFFGIWNYFAKIFRLKNRQTHAVLYENTAICRFEHKYGMILNAFWNK